MPYLLRGLKIRQNPSIAARTSTGKRGAAAAFTSSEANGWIDLQCPPMVLLARATDKGRGMRGTSGWGGSNE